MKNEKAINIRAPATLIDALTAACGTASKAAVTPELWRLFILADAGFQVNIIQNSRDNEEVRTWTTRSQ